jgi:hypothetical protein
MDVALVADVEDEFVFGGFEDPVEGDGEFDDAEVRAEVAAGAGERGDEVLADAVGEEEELFFAELFDVLRTVDLGERGFARRVGLPAGPRAMISMRCWASASFSWQVLRRRVPRS